MKKFYLLLVAMLCGVVATRAQEVNTSWSVGTGANDKANITWIGFAVPEVNDEGDAVTEVPLHNIHLCTNTNGSNEKTAYMVISSTKDINGKVIGAWSTGCLCDLNPRYMPLNNHNLGFARVEVEPDGSFEVHNHKIINGRMV